jgi:hypothetical protein
MPNYLPVRFEPPNEPLERTGRANEVTQTGGLTYFPRPCPSQWTGLALSDDARKSVEPLLAIK